MDPIGRKRWAIAEGDISPRKAHVPTVRSDIARDRLHLGCRRCRCPRRDHDFLFGPQSGRPYCVMVAARRTLHVRFNNLSDPQGYRVTPITRRYSNRCADHRAAHEDGLPPRRDRAVVDDRLFRGLTTVKVTILCRHRRVTNGLQPGRRYVLYRCFEPMLFKPAKLTVLNHFESGSTGSLRARLSIGFVLSGALGRAASVWDAFLVASKLDAPLVPYNAHKSHGHIDIEQFVIRKT
jgi:hypothetical protein